MSCPAKTQLLIWYIGRFNRLVSQVTDPRRRPYWQAISNYYATSLRQIRAGIKFDHTGAQARLIEILRQDIRFLIRQGVS